MTAWLFWHAYAQKGICKYEAVVWIHMDVLTLLRSMVAIPVTAARIEEFNTVRYIQALFIRIKGNYVKFNSN